LSASADTLCQMPVFPIQRISHKPDKSEIEQAVLAPASATLCAMTPLQSTAIDPLCQALARALVQQGLPSQNVPLERLKDKGLAHDHVRLVGTGMLARIPKQSQMQLNALDNLAYQSACFTRASTTGYAPQLMGQLLPCEDLPRGALLVEEIVGRNAALPHDLEAIVQSLAAMHALALPHADDRAPLLSAADPLHDLLAEVQTQAGYFSSCDAAPDTVAMVHTELERFKQLCDGRPRPAQCLIAFDGHPGNFVLRADGRAMLVDLEKCRYSYAPLDLAHATLYTSTTWDLDSQTVLSTTEIAQAYAAWERAVGSAFAQAARPWHVPLRRAMWLWSVTWCAKWRATSGAAARAGSEGEDWSTQRSSDALAQHVRERTAHYLAPPTVQAVLQGFDALEALL
jgi:thiamine kinase-like enzyme